MAQIGQFGRHYGQVLDKFYHALEWRYNDLKARTGSEREVEILAKMLDILLADQVGHDLPLHALESALRHFQKVRHDSFTPKKYAEIMSLMHIEPKETEGYTPHLFGNVMLDSHRSL